MIRSLIIISFIGLAALAFANRSSAQPPSRSLNPSGTARYWTPERLRQAKPFPLPLLRREALVQSQIETKGVQPLEESIGEDAQPPLPGVKANPIRLFAPLPEKASEEVSQSEMSLALEGPANVGTAGGQFSSARLSTVKAGRALYYKSIGKLMFTGPQGDSHCTATVLKRRLVLTAGHCLHEGDGSQSGWHSNFMFIPADESGVAPFGTWMASALGVTTEWFTNGHLGPPNDSDFGILEIQDQLWKGVVQPIGDVTGNLGWLSNKLHPNHVHVFGYPGNLDGGERIHEVTAGTIGFLGGSNTVRYGSDMEGGSSGGPLIQNFGKKANGQGAGLNPAFNRIVGVVSYGYSGTPLLVQGSSVPDSRFVGLLDVMCANQAGNC